MASSCMYKEVNEKVGGGNNVEVVVAEVSTKVLEKRCSLPGPGSLHLHATHQQRRLSERGLMIYRPSKPDIDLIGNFINNPTHFRRVSEDFSSHSHAPLPTITSPSRSPTKFKGYRKVLLKIKKGNGEDGSENKYEIETAGDSNEDDKGDQENEDFLRSPYIDTARRFSDSAAIYSKSCPPLINISTSPEDAGDLRALRCLTSSAQEIRSYGSTSAVMTSDSVSNETPIVVGNRSRSFDATYIGSRSGKNKHIGSSWFSRRHLPISVKLPLSLNSPSVPNSPGPNSTTFKTPLLTVTSDASEQSEIIEVPSPPASTPAELHPLEAKTKVAWDQHGFLVDASVLGSVIENHLRKTDMRRRATVSTLYEPQIKLENPQVTKRARSASACVIIPPPISSSPPKNPGARRSSLMSHPPPSSFKKRDSLTHINSSSSSGNIKRTDFCVDTIVVSNGRRSLSSNGGGGVRTTIKTTYTPSVSEEGVVRGRLEMTEEEAEVDRKRRAAYYKKNGRGGGGSSGEGGGGATGLSICTAIRDFIFQTLK